MFEQTKLFFRNLKRDIQQKFENFVKTGDFNMKNPQIALSTTEFERFSVNTNEMRKEILSEDGVEVIYNPQNVDLECLKHCLNACGYEDEAINEVNLKAGILSFLRYSPYLINKHLDMKHGLAYLFRKNTGETYYMILKPETEHGSILLFENHYMVVKNLPAPMRQMQASFKAKLFNFVFGMLIPDLGFNEVFMHRGQFFYDDQFEDGDHIERWLSQLVSKYFPSYYEWVDVEFYEKEKEWFFNKKLKQNQFLACTQTFYQEQYLLKLLENVSKVLMGIKAVNKAKMDRALYEEIPSNGYRNYKDDVFPESFYPLCLRKEKKPYLRGFYSHYDKFETRDIHVDVEATQRDFFFPGAEIDFDFDGDVLVDHKVKAMFIPMDHIVIEEEYDRLKLENKNLNYYTEEKYIIPLVKNKKITPIVALNLKNFSFKKDLSINGLSFTFPSQFIKEIFMEYCAHLFNYKELSYGMHPFLANDMMFTLMMEYKERSKTMTQFDFLKGDYFLKFKPLRVCGEAYYLWNKSFLVDNYIYSVDLKPATDHFIQEFLNRDKRNLKMLRAYGAKLIMKATKNKLEYTVQFKGHSSIFLVTLPHHGYDLLKPSDKFSESKLVVWMSGSKVMIKNVNFLIDCWSSPETYINAKACRYYINNGYDMSEWQYILV